METIQFNLLEKLTGFQLVKKFPSFYGTRRFITADTSASNPSLSWAISIQSIRPHPAYWRSILRAPDLYGVLSFHYQLSCPFFVDKITPNYQSRSGVYSLTVSQNDMFLQTGIVSTLPNHQAGGPPPVGFLLLLIQYIRSFPPYWRPFLHPQPEDSPCCGDRNPLITGLPTPRGRQTYWHRLQGSSGPSRTARLLKMRPTVSPEELVANKNLRHAKAKRERGPLPEFFTSSNGKEQYQS